MAFKPTYDQDIAIKTNGSILVSAAAGSGKTAVLVERVIRLLCDAENPLYADKLLVVTYTNAAAAELRGRIEQRLFEEFEKCPTDMHLQKQKILFSSAKICTIDAFCLDFIRENFELAGLSPTFKIVDNAELKLFEKNAMASVLNEYFDNVDEEFLALLDFVGDDYDDSRLRKCIKTIFGYSRHIPFPDEWIDSVVDAYKKHSDGLENEWMNSTLDMAYFQAFEAYNSFWHAEHLLSCFDSAYNKYGANYNYYMELAEKLQELTKNHDWNGTFDLISNVSPPKCKNLTAEEKTDEVKLSIELRDSGKSILNDIANLIYAPVEEVRSDIIFTLPHIHKIAELVKAFSAKLYDLLRSHDMITFYMAEQTVLEILFKSDILENGSSPFEDMFDAILVDEYQDTNSLQDMLFSILSKEGNKLFCVGDMKQCIYKFRGSNPTNFLTKKSNSVSLDKFDENSTLRVDLGCNFRSRPEVCDFINLIFQHLIYEENSGFDYDENEMLIPMAVYPSSDAPKVENHLFDFKSLYGNSSFDFQSKLYAEAEFTAAKIKDLIDREAFLRCGDTLRKARYGDITILVRSMRSKGDVFIKVLKDKGIPVSAATSEVLDSDESKTLISFLKLINNPTDDIAALTVLSSPLFGFTFSEIAEIRSVKKYGSVMSAVTVAAENGNEKAVLFLNTIERLRRKSVMVSCGMLIDEIFEETNMLNIYSFGGYGELGRMNLLCIQNLAFSYEKNGSKSLREFLHYISELDDKDIAVSTESSDSVKIMTIHKSKGLQFPICILANAGNQFNRHDINDSVIVNEKYGFSIAYTDDFGLKTDGNILRSLMRSEEKNHLLAEELRVFYVALTRAEEMLITLSSFTDIDKEIAKKSLALQISNSVDRIEPTLFDKNISYADWLLEIFLLKGYIDPNTKESLNELVSIHRDIEIIDSVKMIRTTQGVNHTDVRNLLELFRFEYPYSEILDLQSKSSVSDIVHKADEELYRFTDRPAFLQSKQLSYSEIGTAVHKVMQYVDYEKATTSLDDELDRLYEYMYLTETEIEAVKGKNLKAFFSSSLCRRIIASPFVKREFKFLREISATELIPELDSRFSGEMVVVQGAVDLLFEEEGKLFITDFKTDRCKNEQQLITAYREQLLLYASACEKIFSKPIGGLYLYSFELQKTIEIK